MSAFQLPNVLRLSIVLAHPLHVAFSLAFSLAFHRLTLLSSIRLHEKFMALVEKTKDRIQDSTNKINAEGCMEDQLNPRVHRDVLIMCDWFVRNPFGLNILQAFCSEEAGDHPGEVVRAGHLDFDQFVDMFSHFHPRQKREEKLKAMLRIYAGMGDHPAEEKQTGYLPDKEFGDTISEKDIVRMLDLLMMDDEGNATAEKQDIEAWASEIMTEADEDGSKQLGYSEFKKIMFRDPEFCAKFTIQLL
jgi:Ca2+-binding EF-hand superfamily protein